MRNIIKKEKEIKLCGQQSYCPSIRFKGKNVFIKDDYGNTVRLSRKQIDYLVEEIKKGA